MLFHSPPWDEVVYWSLDLETGGLDAKSDAILAVGMVPVRQGVVKLGEAYSTLVRPDRPEQIGLASIRAHQLVWDEFREAPALGPALEAIDARLRQGALLVHQASIDVSFLKCAYRKHGRRWPRPPVVDTVDLLLRAAHKARFASRTPDEVPALNLSQARRDARLPEYQAHDPLVDAIAAAELFLVLRHRLGARRLGELT
jgi:DNA polymerase-3 subunit epsilon